MIITIDGPAGSGKTSAARMLAEHLGIKVLQTGLLYRAAAFVLLKRKGIVDGALEDNDGASVSSQVCGQVRDAVTQADVAALASISYDYDDGVMYPFVTIDDKRCEGFLSRAWLSLPASIISQNQAIRQWSLEVQRAVAREYGVVAEGRDCGTVVFPDADAKFFLTASPEARAERIMRDKSRKTMGMTRDEALASIAERDGHDEKRVIAPLIAASGAIIIDSSHLSQEDVMREMLGVIKKSK